MTSRRLIGRLDSLGPVIASQREARKAEKAQRVVESKAAKEKIVAEAETLATGNDWRAGANRLRSLLDEWKALPRIDRASDDELWKRFSSARTTYTRRRKTHFAEQNEKREGARVVKERLAKEAEELADSTDWGPTAGRYRDLMRQWKAAGAAPKDVDDELWKRFRGAQDSVLRCPRRRQRRPRRRVRRQRRGQGEAAGRGRGPGPGHRPRGRQERTSATSPTGGTPPARSPATG